MSSDAGTESQLGIRSRLLAHLVFPTHNEAFQAIAKLHGHTYKGAVISCVLKKRLEKLGGAGGAASHAGRLIVRNLSWDVGLPHNSIEVFQRLTPRPRRKTSERHSSHSDLSTLSTYLPYLPSSQLQPIHPNPPLLLEREDSHSSGS